jgi:hypothetical protein
MTGLKSGSGDDLWGDDADDENDDDAEETNASESSPEPSSTTDTGPNSTDEADAGGTGPMTGGSAEAPGAGDGQQPYIVRRAIQDKSVQFERDERLTFFVHDDVAEGERELLSDAEAALGRSIPKFDLREAVYRAALRNREDVLAELVKMGYSFDD